MPFRLMPTTLRYVQARLNIIGRSPSLILYCVMKLVVPLPRVGGVDPSFARWWWSHPKQVDSHTFANLMYIRA